tara:strand:- start:389 stop:571 length:183 start_codon:yes stop_codon:yes gene_type:complete
MYESWNRYDENKLIELNLKVAQLKKQLSRMNRTMDIMVSLFSNEIREHISEQFTKYLEEE